MGEGETREVFGVKVPITDGKIDLRGFDPFHLNSHGKRIAPWGNEAVREFVKVDPENGRNLETLRLAGKIHATSALFGAAAVGTYTLRKTRSASSAALMAVGGAMTAFFVSEAAGYFALSVNRIDRAKTNHAFLDWWAKKNE